MHIDAEIYIKIVLPGMYFEAKTFLFAQNQEIHRISGNIT